MTSQWVNEAARQARLQRIESQLCRAGGGVACRAHRDGMRERRGAPGASRGVRAGRCAAAGTAAPRAQAAPRPTPLRFGVLPVGGAVESRESWTPLLAELSRALGRPVTVLSATTYEALGEAHPAAPRST